MQDPLYKLFVQFGRLYLSLRKIFVWIYFEFGPVAVQKKFFFRFLALVAVLFTVILVDGNSVKLFWIFEVQISFKDISILYTGGHFIQCSGTVHAIFIWTSGSVVGIV